MLSIENFLSILNSYPASGKYWIACSGGMDSCVLLHLFYSCKSKIKQPLEVVYVNHGLQEEGEGWGKFCKELCLQYEIAFLRIDINENCPKGKSIEEWARDKRYSLIAERMEEKDILFTAHHQDDQVETFFLQALRGAGPRGLVSMPIFKKYANGFHARPLLHIPRSKIKNYAIDNKLSWYDDKSNTDTRYDRNYLRKNVLPVVESRWPAFRESISRLINHQKEYKTLLDEVAQEDLKHTLNTKSGCLNINNVRELSIERQKNLIFIWLGTLKLNPPASKHMDNIITELINIDTDKAPCVNWNNVEVRRYKNFLYSSKTLTEHDVYTKYNWDLKKPITILDETLTPNSIMGRGISKKKITDASIMIRYRQGGEKVRPDNLKHSKTVKQLFQERGVLPWLRDRIPLVYVNDKLAVIPGFCVDEAFSAENNEPSIDIQWSGYDKVIQQDE